MNIFHKGEETERSGVIADFVLVHGLTGNYLNTWTKEKDDQEEYCWPRDMLPHIRPDMRIMSYSYDADVTHPCGRYAAAGDLVEYADTFLTWLNTERYGTEAYTRPLIFFGHSLGGLVIEKAILIASRSETSEWRFKIFQCTEGIFTWGTPHYGSSFASLAMPLARLVKPFHYFNTKLLEAVKPALAKKVKGIDGNPLLPLEWQEEFIALLTRREVDHHKIVFFCGVEQLGTAGIPFLHRVVPGRSAILRGGRNIVERCNIHTNHSDLVRFNDPRDEGFRVFMPFLTSILVGLPTPPPTGRILAPESQVVPAHTQTAANFRVELLPVVKKDFIGRETTLANIFDELKTWQRDYPAIVVLVANGGWGKSQIALEFARRYYEDRSFEAVFWVDACSEQAAKRNFARIWDKLKPGTGLLSVDEKFAKAYEALQTMTQRWLLVLDNFDRSVLDTDQVRNRNNATSGRNSPDAVSRLIRSRRTDSDSLDESYIKRFIPKNDFGHIIITTRDSRVATLGTDIDVPLMTEEEAIAMLRDRYVKAREGEQCWDEESAKAIAQEFGCLPLAIEQVAANLASTQIAMTRFLNEYRKNRRSILDSVPQESNFRRSYVPDGTSYVKKVLNVVTVWEMSFTAVEQYRKTRTRDLAIEMLNMAGFLDRTGISIKFLCHMELVDDSKSGRHHWTNRRHAVSDMELDKAARLLDRWHLIESLDEDRNQAESFTLHPLVQDWIRLRMGKSDLYKAVMRATKLIERNLAEDHDTLLATSVQSKYEIIGHIGAIRDLLATNRPDLEGLNNVKLGLGTLSDVTISFGSFYYDVGDLKNAESLFELVRKNHSGDNENKDPMFLQAEEGLALVRLWEENGDAAYRLLSHAQRGYATLSAKYKRAFLRATHNLGEVECFRKNFDEAIRLFQSSLEGFSDEFGKTSKETYREHEALGNAYRAKGDITKALHHIKKAQKELEEIDPLADSTINATESLALVMKASGNLQRAEQLYRTVIGIYERSVGKSQYTTLGAMGGLADTYRKGKQWDKARKEYEEIMARLRDNLGTQEPQYIRAAEALENITSQNPELGPPDDFSYPWPRSVGEYQTRAHQKSMIA